jgi:esterase/lipase
MVLAGKEVLVDNDAARSFFNNSQVKHKDLIEYGDADHCIMQDNEFWPLVTKDIISWQNTHS